MGGDKSLREESIKRKSALKKIIDEGGRLAEVADNCSVIQNLANITRLMNDANEVAKQGKLSDRIGQNAEVVLDAQVNRIAIAHCNHSS